MTATEEALIYKIGVLSKEKEEAESLQRNLRYSLDQIAQALQHFFECESDGQGNTIYKAKKITGEQLRDLYLKAMQARWTLES